MELDEHISASGVPNWQNAEEYPQSRDLDNSHWRWEFLRRHPDYRGDWLQFRDVAFELEVEWHDHGVKIQLHNVEIDEVLTSWDLVGALLDPRDLIRKQENIN